MNYELIATIAFGLLLVGMVWVVLFLVSGMPHGGQKTPWDGKGARPPHRKGTAPAKEPE